MLTLRSSRGSILIAQYTQGGNVHRVRRTTTLIAAFALLVAGLAACGGDDDDDSSAGATDTSEASQTEIQTVTVGQIAHLSGAGEMSWGKPVDQGMRLALTEIEESGYLEEVGLALEFETEDDASDPTQAATIYRDFVGQNFPIIVSSALTPVASVLAPMANEDQVPYIAVGSGGTGDDAADYFFRMLDVKGTMTTLGEYLAEEAGDAGVGLILDKDNAAFGPISKLAEAGLPDGFKVTETVSAQDSDFSTVLTNLQREGLGAILLAVAPSQAGNILRQMEEGGGFEDVIKAGHLGWTTEVSSVAEGAAEDAVFALPWAEGPGDEEFVSTFEDEYGAAPTAYAALGHDTGWLIAVALRRAVEAGDDLSGEALRDALAAAASDADFADHNVVDDFSLTEEEIPSYEGTLVRFDADGAIAPLG